MRHAIEADDVDLIVLGTHGRTGAEKLLLGSVAEEIFRRSPVPVLTIGPGVRSSTHNAGRFRRVLFATDLSPESLAAAPYAITLAQENQARLALLLVMRKPDSPSNGDKRLFDMSVAEAIIASTKLFRTTPISTLRPKSPSNTASPRNASSNSPAGEALI